MKCRSRLVRMMIASAVGAAALFAAAPTALAHPVVTDPSLCITCHEYLTPGIVDQYHNGAMGDGVDGDATCVDCHTTDPTGGKVPASRCATCHQQQYDEFAVKDGGGAYINKHAIGWTKMTAGARYMAMPQEERSAMCERCHNVGYVYDDGSVGKCDSCHTRHTFSAAEAREPDACGTCHMGPDHEQIDMWEKSKHGVVYRTEQGRPDGHPERAPTCVTCHMPDGTNEGGNGAGLPLVHNVSTNLTLGTVSQGASLNGTAQSVPMRSISQAAIDTARTRMKTTCEQCHSASFVTANLDAADEIKRDVDDLLWDPVMRVRGLWYDRLIDPMPENRAPNPAYPLLNGGQILVIGGQQLYGGTSRIEQLFFNTYKYDHVSTFKGAYHINPDYSHWFGWARVNSDRDIIKGEEAALRSYRDPGFTVSTTRATVLGPTSFDATALTDWGNASENTFEWYFGDGAHVAAAPDAATQVHAFEHPGTYQVQLTVSDSDLVNNVLTPDQCSAKRTTTTTVTVKNSSKLALASIARVRAGKQATVKVTFTTGAAVSGASLELWSKVGSGSWTKLSTKAATTAAGVPLTVTFKPTLKKKTSYKVMWTGDRVTWDATSNVRTVTPK
jgi:hydroxylamine dehydrogenase